ncbi:zinc-binding dehydrogenase, putative [Candida dubliniensis CD36]|uniref:Zinc-binding dehydrogenase, putative n=1 Tax=Candida dubliniensis (strain CD36 / ATCC MYA-646 / CBS 7987 / NCPF 3949 / NRRL Y-17841) TaxID=573826 RepID=B9WCT0_CANDC|nr:zinc-binding dehydrogenase, putative [Candida dubliniensis CD36]CAX44204.1 zinc-binding dehydrogenase, putative [Candida dubliniensis CD36]
MKAAVVPESVTETKLAEVKEIPKPTINDDQILIKAEAGAINPTDWKHIILARTSKPGDVIGCDVSGIVEEVGSKVTNFKKGDAVSSYVTGNISPVNGAFSEYAAAYPQATIKYINGLTHSSTETKASTIKTFEGAASMTLGLGTVAMSFSHHLNIGKHQKIGDSILIWGGATATGILAIQVAKLVYNLTVITTASPRNHEYLKQLGADYVLDYNDPNIVENIKKIGNGSIRFALDTVSNATTFQYLYDATATETNNDMVYLDSLLALDGNIIKTDPAREKSVHWGYTFVDHSIIKVKEFGDKKYYQTPELFNDYYKWWQEIMPTIINKIKHANLKILDKGLESVNEALQLSKDSKVSAEKIVFTI